MKEKTEKKSPLDVALFAVRLVEKQIGVKFTEVEEKFNKNVKEGGYKSALDWDMTDLVRAETLKKLFTRFMKGIETVKSLAEFVDYANGFYKATEQDVTEHHCFSPNSTSAGANLARIYEAIGKLDFVKEIKCLLVDIEGDRKERSKLNNQEILENMASK